MGVFLFFLFLFIVIVGGCKMLGRLFGEAVWPEEKPFKFKKDNYTIHNHHHYHTHNHNQITENHLHISEEDLKKGIDDKNKFNT